MISEQALAVILASMALISLVALAVWVLLVVATWKIFTKAGEAGWKSIIPFYSTYIQYKISWNTNMFWVMIGIVVLSFIGGWYLIPLISTVCGLANLVIGIMAMNKLSKSFGHGVGFTIGLLFLNPIFMLILGFGSSQYQGPQN